MFIQALARRRSGGPHLSRGGSPAPSYLDPAWDQVRVRAGRNAVAGGGLGHRVLDGSPVEADEEARYLGEQVVPVAGHLTQFGDCGGGLRRGGLALVGVPPSRPSQAGHRLLIDLGLEMIAHGDCPVLSR